MRSRLLSTGVPDMGEMGSVKVEAVDEGADRVDTLAPLPGTSAKRERKRKAAACPEDSKEDVQLPNGICESRMSENGSVSRPPSSLASDLVPGKRKRGRPRKTPSDCSRTPTPNVGVLVKTELDLEEPFVGRVTRQRVNGLPRDSKHLPPARAPGTMNGVRPYPSRSVADDVKSHKRVGTLPKSADNDGKTGMKCGDPRRHTRSSSAAELDEDAPICPFCDSKFPDYPARWRHFQEHHATELFDIDPSSLNPTGGSPTRRNQHPPKKEHFVNGAKMTNGNVCASLNGVGESSSSSDCLMPPPPYASNRGLRRRFGPCVLTAAFIKENPKLIASLAKDKPRPPLPFPVKTESADSITCAFCSAVFTDRQERFDHQFAVHRKELFDSDSRPSLRSSPKQVGCVCYLYFFSLS